MDSELKKENLIIADILLSCLCPNVSNVVFIVPRIEDQDKVMDLVVTITDNLVGRGFHNKELHACMLKHEFILNLPLFCEAAGR